jgi:hypothetical protein
MSKPTDYDKKLGSAASPAALQAQLSNHPIEGLKKVIVIDFFAMSHYREKMRISRLNICISNMSSILQRILRFRALGARLRIP